MYKHNIVTKCTDWVTPIHALVDTIPLTTRCDLTVHHQRQTGSWHLCSTHFQLLFQIPLNGYQSMG